MTMQASSRWELILFIMTILICLSNSKSEQKISREFKNKQHIVPKNYLKHIIPPTENGQPLQVNFSMRVFVISSINFDDMDISVDLYLKQEWHDVRITIPDEIFEYGDDYVNLPSQIFDSLWQPDLYFLNSKEEEKSTMAHRFSSVTLFKNKTIQLVIRLHAVVACPMEFYHYPMDTQICPIAIESFSYNNEKILLQWSGSGVSFAPQLKHRQYNILPLHLEQTNIYTPEKNGNFSRLIVYFAFERQIGHAVIQVFAPSTLIVVLSWFSFWLDFDAIPGRITLLVTCMLSLVTMFTDLRVETPLVDYVKALDIWMAGCMISVFGAVAEFILAKILFVKYNELKKKESENPIKNNTESAASEFLDPNSLQYVHNFQYKNSSAEEEHIVRIYWITATGKEKKLWQECDKLSRAIFPLFFLIFMIIYWTIMIYDRSKYRKYLDDAYSFTSDSNF